MSNAPDPWPYVMGDPVWYALQTGPTKLDRWWQRGVITAINGVDAPTYFVQPHNGGPVNRFTAEMLMPRVEGDLGDCGHSGSQHQTCDACNPVARAARGAARKPAKRPSHQPAKRPTRADMPPAVAAKRRAKSVKRAKR